MKPLIDYLVPLLRFKDPQKEQGLDIPFIFHAGETLGVSPIFPIFRS